MFSKILGEEVRDLNISDFESATGAFRCDIVAEAHIHSQ